MMNDDDFDYKISAAERYDGMKEENVIIEKIKHFIAGALAHAMIFGFLWGVVQFIWQIYAFLKRGFWESYSILDMIRITPLYDAIVSPSSWVGLTGILESVLSAFAPGWFLFIFGTAGFFYYVNKFE